jgi:hypothetical protein
MGVTFREGELREPLPRVVRAAVRAPVALRALVVLRAPVLRVLVLQVPVALRVRARVADGGVPRIALNTSNTADN